MQNATARALAVPDLTTTVLTLTLTGLAADSRIGGARPSRPLRRVASVLAMLVGALVGALLVLDVGVAAALGFACILQAVVAAAGMVLSAGSAPAAWTPPRPRHLTSRTRLGHPRRHIGV